MTGSARAGIITPVMLLLNTGLSIRMPLRASGLTRRVSMTATDNPFFETWTTPFGAPPFSPHQARAFHAGLRARLRRARGGDRDDRGPERAADLRQHHRRAGERRPRLAARRRRVRPALRHRQQRHAAGDRARHLAPHRGALEQGADERRHVRAHRRALSKARRAWPDRRADARAGAPPHQVSPRGRGARSPTRSNASPIIVERLAALGTAFSQNVLADEQSYTMELDGEADLAGLPDFVARRGGRRGRQSAA